MLNYQNLFISLLLFFCCYATYTDLRERKIKNFCSYGLIYAGILSQVISVFSGSSGLLNSIITVVGGFLIVLTLYWFGIFAAGDAKLVWGASLLMPVGLFSEASAFAQYTPTSLIINIFVPYCVILVMYLCLKTNVQQKWQAFMSIFQQEDFRQQIFEMVFRLIFLLGLRVVVTLSLGWLGIELRLWHQLLVVFSLYFILSYYVKKVGLERIRNYVVSVVMIQLMIITTPWTLDAWSQAYAPLLKIYLFYLTVFFFGRYFIENLDSMVLDREVNISDLKEGMVPAEQIVRIKGDDAEVTYSKQGFALPNVLNSNIVLGTLPGGVSKEKAAQLKQLSEDGKFEDFDNRIRIQRSLRFAPMICLGVILTILCRGPFFMFFQ
ncbi:MAG: prepilin peptidase [Candidatus Poribacteria bacterium]|nr:prepilin peptidase [Candidatus Poribacteria bacterium]